MFFGRFMSALVVQRTLPLGGSTHAGTDQGVFPEPGNRSRIIALAGIEAVIREGPTLIFASQPDFVDSIAESVLAVLSLGTNLAHWSLGSSQLPGRRDPEGMRMLKRSIRLAEGMTGPGSLVVRALKAGFIIHHGGIPKSLRAELEILAREGVVRLTIATNTLAQGVNLPVKIILIHSLTQGRDRYVPSTDFWNICGRAGRAMHENEGLVLLLADETSPPPSSFQTAKDYAKWLLRWYVRRAQSHALVSAIKQFLGNVIDVWRDSYPDAEVAELCEHLADNEIDWLPEKEKHQLEVLDAQLLALLEEAEGADTTPEFVQNLFERSLLLLQLSQAGPDEPLATSTAVDMLAARIKHVCRVVPEKRRRQFYRMGLALSDCRYVEANRSQIEQVLEMASGYMDWSPEQRSDYLTDLCRTHLMKLSDIRPDRPTDLPACWPRIVQRWLLGQAPEEIAQDPQISREVGDIMQVSSVIDELCDYRLPWGFNALHNFWQTDMVSIEAGEETVTLPAIISYFPSMIRHGVHSPGATILLATGLESRQAAIACADQYSGVIEPASVLAWVRNLTVSDVGRWELEPAVRDDILAFARRLREREYVANRITADFTIHIPDQSYLSPLGDGTTLVTQPIPPDQVVLYSPAVERLGVIHIKDEHIFRQVQTGQMTATIHGDLGVAHNGWQEVSIAFLPISPQS